MPREALLTVEGLSVRFGSVAALAEVDLEVGGAARLGITGVSGSGKSTLARCLAGWEVPSEGVIHRRAGVQMVLQDPAASLNPRFSAIEVIEEPLRIRGEGSKEARRARALCEMERTGLDASRGDACCGTFSGGEKARMAIARAMAALEPGRPGVLILDESLGSLDEDTQERTLALLNQLQAPRNLTYLVVSHDLQMLAGFCPDLLVLDQGRVVEQGRTADLLQMPGHAATQRLVAAAGAGN